jgi:alkanesulfonate monooxygenase SsuD/methylene tetrahydromethanopterin reductase-like flavin-dependent oxidoreductase (luciferase family)
VLAGLFNNERTTFKGEFYELRDAPLNPKPVQQPLPLLIGAMGEKVALRIVAKYANAWNTWAEPETFAHKSSVLEAHCADVGRDPGSIERTVVALVLLSDDAGQIEEARARGRPLVSGSTDEVCRTIQAYVDAGASEFIVPDFNMPEPIEQRKAMMDRFQSEIVPAFR